MHLALIRSDPLAAELVGLAADLGVEQPPADAIACLEDDDLAPGRDELGRGDQAGKSSTDHRDVDVMS